MTAQAGGASPLPSQAAQRRQLRTRRRELSPTERLAAERAIHRAIARLGVWRRGARVAVYLPMRGEVDLRPGFDDAWRRGVRLYVPRIVDRRAGRMAFVPLERDAALGHNAFGIAEPRGWHGRTGARGLDTVLLPLVGFDAHGHRIGMGAGFYDRAFAHRRDRSTAWRRPRLVGVAYSIQQVERIEPAPWDVALDFVVTERGVLDCRAASTSTRMVPP